MPPFDSSNPVAEEPAANPGFGNCTAATAVPHEYRYPLKFTGSGSEYFRVWLVNILLTLLTLGLYAPWAEVRKTRYFYRHTTLDGYGFEYHGNPWAIFRGQLIALPLLAAYLAIEQAPRGIAAILLLAIVLAVPFLLVLSLRFSLSNTSWRGLRFGFDADPALAYRQMLVPVCALASIPGIAALVRKVSLVVHSSAQLHFLYFAIVTVLVLWLGSVPWAHFRLKAFQHGSARWGNAKFSFHGGFRSFLLVYSVVLGMLVCISFLATWAVLATMSVEVDPSNPWALTGTWNKGLGTAIGLVLGWVLLRPYFATRLQATVWANTRIAGASFEFKLGYWRFIGLTLGYGLLTLLSLGLCWPLAATAIARARVEAMSVVSPKPIDELAQGVVAPAVSAVGDGAAHLFGLDVGL